MAGKYVIKMTDSGEFRFRLKASNGESIVTGECCKTKPSCMGGVESIRKNSDAVVEIVK